MAEKDISKATLRRLPTYLSYLKSLPADAAVNISATAIAAGLNMGEVQVRKDLALISDGGRPKIGYNRERLIDDIEAYLGYDNRSKYCQTIGRSSRLNARRHCSFYDSGVAQCL